MIKRHIFKSLCNEISKPEIIILLGARQVGKTTLLRSLEQYCLKQKIKTGFFDLEQHHDLSRFNLPAPELRQMIVSAGDVVFIDEFQYIANASRIFKSIFDASKKPKIICSGSSSLDIHRHLKESLAGRRFLYRIYPLSYSELSTQTDMTFEEYLIYGGMPGLTHTDSEERKQQILSELLNAYILKDVKSLVKEENLRAFNHMLYILAEKQGSVLSVHSMANEINMSSKAVNRYLDILESTYVICRVFSYSKNLGNELKKSYKTYLYDIGMRNALLRDFSGIQERSDKGAVYETFVFLHLDSQLKPNMEIKFWRTKDGKEVDFILLKNRKPFPIEVKSHLTSLDVPKGLSIFLKRYPETTKAFVVNEEHIGTVMHGSTEVRFLTFQDISLPAFWDMI